VSLGVAVLIARDLLALPAEDRVFVRHLFDWIDVGPSVSASTSGWTPLSLTMILVVTAVGSLIHLYSIGYMDGDPRFGRFFAYLNLFLLLHAGAGPGENLLVLYLGWEVWGLARTC